MLPSLVIPVAILSLASDQDPTLALAPLLGVPHMEDGAQDADGNWVTFAEPHRVRQEPGLNCSGFVVAACRRLLDYQGTLAEASFDRRGDSGSGAKLGADWDFGMDLILNLSQGHPRALVLPSGELPLPDGDGRRLRGFSLSEPELWPRLLPRFRPGHLYLASLSSVKEGRLSHHHVGLIVVDGAGRPWWYHSLPKGRVHRLGLDTPEGQERFHSVLGKTQWLLLVSVKTIR